MNAALVIGAGAVALPLAAFEARCKWHDWKERTGRDPHCDGLNAAFDADRVAAGPVWMGYDHRSGSYPAVIDCAAGNAGDLSTSDGGCGGGDA